MSSCYTATVVACRILGLYVVLRLADDIFGTAISPLLIAMLFGPHSPFDKTESVWMLSALALSVTLAIVLAVTVWKTAPWIATKMLAHAEAKQWPSSEVSLEDIQVVAISILGLLLICEALPWVAAMSMEHIWSLRISGDEHMISATIASMIKSLTAGLTKLGLGIWLFFGARSFVRLFQRFCPARQV